jgi:hypothetical protein
MKNIVVVSFLILSMLSSGIIFAQDKVDNKSVFTTAIELIEGNKELSEQDKKKFVSRLEVIAKTNKEIQEKEYTRIADNYKNTTGLDLPKFKSDKE